MLADRGAVWDSLDIINILVCVLPLSCLLVSPLTCCSSHLVGGAGTGAGSQCSDDSQQVQT